MVVNFAVRSFFLNGDGQDWIWREQEGILVRVAGADGL